MLVRTLPRTTGVVSDAGLNVIAHAQTLALAAALFGMGTGVHLNSLLRSSARAMALATVSTLVIASVALAGVMLLI